MEQILPDGCTRWKVKGGKKKIINHSHGSVKKSIPSIMEIWLQAVTDRRADWPTLSISALHREHNNNNRVSTSQPLHINITRVYWCLANPLRISPMARTTCRDNSKCHIVNHDAGRDPIKCVAGIKAVSSRVIEHLKTDFLSLCSPNVLKTRQQ